MSADQMTDNAAKLRAVSRGGGGRLPYMEAAADELDRLRAALEQFASEDAWDRNRKFWLSGMDPIKIARGGLGK